MDPQLVVLVVAPAAIVAGLAASLSPRGFSGAAGVTLGFLTALLVAGEFAQFSPSFGLAWPAFSREAPVTVLFHVSLGLLALAWVEPIWESRPLAFWGMRLLFVRVALFFLVPTWRDDATITATEALLWGWGLDLAILLAWAAADALSGERLPGPTALVAAWAAAGALGFALARHARFASPGKAAAGLAGTLGALAVLAFFPRWRLAIPRRALGPTLVLLLLLSVTGYFQGSNHDVPLFAIALAPLALAVGSIPLVARRLARGRLALARVAAAFLAAGASLAASGGWVEDDARLLRPEVPPGGASDYGDYEEYPE